MAESILERPFGQTTYAQLLKKPAWILMRKSIIQSDKNRCAKCGIITDNLQVHHLYYIDKHKPWQYDKKALITLCGDCHRKVHEKKLVPIYDSDPEQNKEAKILPIEMCDRCKGNGYIQEYLHVEDGICFSCMGTGYKSFCIQFGPHAEIQRFWQSKKMKKNKIQINDNTDLPF